MEKEFNFNGDSEIGTSVSKLKNNVENFKNTETDIDYDKILENFNNNSDTINVKTNFNYDSVRNNTNPFTSTSIADVRPKKSINMAQFAKNVEFDLEKGKNIRSYNYNEPLPVNYSNQLQKLEQTINLKSDNLNLKPENQITTATTTTTECDLIQKYKGIVINVLFFILLNNKFIIELIYDKIPIVKKYSSPYPNLLIRSALFGLIIWSIKKFNI